MDVVSDLCSVRRRNVGDITKMLRTHHDTDFAGAMEARRSKNKAKYEAAIEKAKREANEINKAASVVLINSVAELRPKLAACNGVVKTSRALLQTQIRTRLQLGCTYPISAVGHEYRSAKKPYKIRWTKPGDDSRTEVAYLTDLAEAMLTFDLDNEVVLEQPTEDLVRTVHEISSTHTSAKGKQLRADLNAQISAAAEPEDDALAVELLHAYGVRCCLLMMIQHGLHRHLGWRMCNFTRVLGPSMTAGKQRANLWRCAKKAHGACRLST